MAKFTFSVEYDPAINKGFEDSPKCCHNNLSYTITLPDSAGRYEVHKAYKTFFNAAGYSDKAFDEMMGDE